MSDYSRRRTPGTSQGSAGNPHSDMQFAQGMGTSAAVDLMKVQGNNTDAVGRAFSRDDLKNYIEHQLKFADGEWFRGMKISGATDEIMALLDADRDGYVDWFEFQTMVAELKMTLLDDIGPNAGTEEIQAEANHLFSEISGGSGSIGFDQLEWETHEKLPEETENRNLVAQLIALLIIDIVDVDEANKAVRDRTVNEDEWKGAVNSFTGSGA